MGGQQDKVGGQKNKVGGQKNKVGGQKNKGGVKKTRWGVKKTRCPLLNIFLIAVLRWIKGSRASTLGRTVPSSSANLFPEFDMLGRCFDASVCLSQKKYIYIKSNPLGS